MEAELIIEKNEQSATTVLIDDEAKRTHLTNNLEKFLAIACKAEGKRNYFRAARACALALLCEGKLRPEVTDACAYVRQAMPVY